MSLRASDKTGWTIYFLVFWLNFGFLLIVDVFLIEYFFYRSATNFWQWIWSSKHVRLFLILVQVLSENVTKLIAEDNELFYILLGDFILFLSFLDRQHIIKCESARKKRFIEFLIVVIRVICALNTLYCLNELFIGNQIIILKFLWDDFDAIVCSRLLSLWLLTTFSTLCQCLLLILQHLLKFCLLKLLEVVLDSNLTHYPLKFLLGLFISNHVLQNHWVNFNFRALFSEDSLNFLEHV